MKKQEPRVNLKLVREALADYISSEGCGCCQNRQKHDEAEARLAKFLHVPKYSDGSGYEFIKFQSAP